MKHLYLSNYCVLFQDYDWIERCVRSFQDFPIGVEFATSWTTPGFYEELERQERERDALRMPLRDILRQLGRLPDASANNANSAPSR